MRGCAALTLLPAKINSNIEIFNRIIKSLVGIDLNPLAVIAAKTNFIISIADLLENVNTEFELPIYQSDGPTQVKNPDGSTIINDLVKFRIQAVDTDGPDSGKWMVFRAYITDFSDNVDSQWNEIEYAGRGDKFFIYNRGTKIENYKIFLDTLNIKYDIYGENYERFKDQYPKHIEF